ncbi:MAG: potassium channel protein [Kiritimatiellaceae bacterium]|nr:potassium channel protein [Kiritimatiellaceae bacterium]
MKRGIYHFDQSRTLRLGLYLLLVLSVLVGGTAGYHLIEGWPLDESLYMTVITVSTVGFGEVHALSHNGRIFTILLIFFGVTSVALSLTSMFEYFILRGLKNLFGRNKMDKQIEKLNRHIIICGFGRTGDYIARDLKKMNKPFVVIENDPARIKVLEEEGVLYIQGDPAEEDQLEAAGVARAESLVASLPKDADNLFLTINARSMNRDLHIIARVQDSDNGRKLIKAGANQVVSPFSTGASRIVQLLTRPSAVDMIELVTQRENLELEVCEILVDEKSNLVRKTLAESRVRQTLGCMVFAVKRLSGETLFDPDPQLRIESGDVLLAIKKPRPASGQ